MHRNGPGSGGVPRPLVPELQLGARGRSASRGSALRGNESGGLFAAIPLDPLLALILSLRIADGFCQHLAQLSLGLCGFPLGWLPLGHGHYVGMREGELNPSYDRQPARPLLRA